MKLSRNQMMLIVVVIVVALFMFAGCSVSCKKAEKYSLPQSGHCTNAVMSPMEYAMDGCGMDQTHNPAYSEDNSYHQIDIGAVDMYPDTNKLNQNRLFLDMRHDWTGPN